MEYQYSDKIWYSVIFGWYPVSVFGPDSPFSTEVRHAERRHADGPAGLHDGEPGDGVRADAEPDAGKLAAGAAGAAKPDELAERYVFSNSELERIL